MRWLSAFGILCYRLTGHYLAISCILDMFASALRLGSFALLILMVTHSFTGQPIHIPQTGWAFTLTSPSTIILAGIFFLTLYTVSAAGQFMAEQLSLKTASAYYRSLKELGIPAHRGGTAALIFSKLLNRSSITFVSLLFVAIVSPLIMLISMTLFCIALLLLRNLIRLSPREIEASEDAYDVGTARNKWMLASSIANACIITCIFIAFALLRKETGIAIHDLVLAFIGLRMALGSGQAVFVHVQRLYRMRVIIGKEAGLYRTARQRPYIPPARCSAPADTPDAQ